MLFRSGEGSDHPERPKEKKSLETSPTKDHMLNWIECIRSRAKPAADMDAGYRHGVAVVMGDLAYLSGRKVMFDPEKREVRPV